MKLYEFYEDDRNFHLVTEFISGGELFDYIVQSGNVGEPTAARFT